MNQIDQSAHHDHDAQVYSKTLFGFWVYLVTDFMLFATFFVTYAVYSRNTVGGPGPSELFHLPFALAQTLVLLASSFTIGIATALAHKNKKGASIAWFAITFLIAIVFMCMQFHEYGRLVSEGYTWSTNAFLSAFYTLVGMHTLHVIFGLIWFILFMISVISSGFTATNLRRVSCLKMFWQFIYVVWIFIFTIVYLIGVQ